MAAKSEKELCIAFFKNPTCNPYTNHKILYNGPTYKKLVRQFGVPPTTTTSVQSYRARPKPKTPQQLQRKQLVFDIFTMSNEQLLGVAQQHGIFVFSRHVDSSFAFNIVPKLTTNKYNVPSRSMLERLPIDMIKEIWRHLDYQSIGRLHRTNIFFANMIQDKYIVNVTEKIRQSLALLPKIPTTFLLTRYKSYNNNAEVEVMLAQPRLGSTLEKFDILGKPLPDRPKYVVTYLHPHQHYPYNEGRYTQAKVKPLVSRNENVITLNPIDIEYDIMIVGDCWCFANTFEKIEFD